MLRNRWPILAEYTPIEKYYEQLDTYLDKEYKSGNYEKVIQCMNLIDTIAENDKITHKRRSTISYFYKKKGTDFLNKKKISTALVFFALANRYRPDCVDKNLYDSCFQRIKDYDERLFVQIDSNWEEEKRIDTYKNIIHTEINKKYRDFFQKGDSLVTSTKVILISIDRIENNIEQSKPQTKYSKFISGYNRVPNQEYYRAQQSAEEARMQINSIAAQRTYGLADAIVQGIAMGTWRAVLNNSLQKLNSDEVYDQVPILVDYTYSQTDMQINNLVQMSYCIIDLKRKKKLKEDSITETSNKAVVILEGVHPQDANSLRNSDKFNFNNQRQEFLYYVDSVFDRTAGKISEDSANFFDERTKDYIAISEMSDALDSHLTGYILKNGTWTESVYDVIPNELSSKLHDLSPYSSLSKKIATRKDPIASVKLVSAESKVVSKNLASSETKGKGWEVDIPSLIEKSKNKVVFIKSITSTGISQGSGFFVSSNGNIITNHHIIKNSTAVIVKTTDGHEYVAKVLKSDSSSDLALLKIDVKDVPYFKLCDSDESAVGQTVIAIGAPLGLDQTVSKGIISAKRQMPLSKTRSKLRMLQTDAQMTHGNSGGPLINLEGEVVGVNTLTLNAPESPQGPVNFAISANEIANRIQGYAH